LDLGEFKTTGAAEVGAATEKIVLDRTMVIIGAGHAGARAAQALRGNGWRGRITLLETENVAPYERPPLSKAALLNGKGFEDFPIFPDGFIASEAIDHLRGITAISINRTEQSVACSDGTILHYASLLLAPGAEPRKLAVPGINLGRVTFLRSGAHSTALGRWMTTGTRIVVIGGGLIGLEAAASAVARGCITTVVEYAPRLMQRGIPEAIASDVQRDHELAGVEFCLGRTVTQLFGEENVTGVKLDDGRLIPCDIVLVCVGVLPRTELAERCGLAVENGIAVDQFLTTSDNSIFAAGDACSFEDDESGRRIRLECWKNAEDQAVIAARNMMGGVEKYRASPWMWSDQYDKVIQVAGYPDLACQSIHRQSDDGSLILFHLDDSGVVTGVSGYGSLKEVSRAVRVGQTMIERKLRPNPTMLADSVVALKDLLIPVVA
jgi:NADPH-dependent 2,4-dienoyl-CoA reductase/sulfur reductase-like enzyme